MGINEFLVRYQSPHGQMTQTKGKPPCKPCSYISKATDSVTQFMNINIFINRLYHNFTMMVINEYTWTDDSN